MSVIVDGMTQKTTEILYNPCDAPKSIATLRYELHVFGSLVLGKTPRDAGIPTGSKLSIETLWRVLHLYEKDCLPPHWMTQVLIIRTVTCSNSVLGWSRRDISKM